MKNKILVIYVGVSGICAEDIQSFVNKVTNKIMPKTFKGEIIIIPTNSTTSRIECINPKYITKPELIWEHTKMINKIQEELQHQLGQLKKQNNNE